MNDRVALINPGSSHIFAVQEPLNLGFLASYLKREGIEVRIIDELAGQDVASELRAFAPRIAGITATTPMASSAYRVADICRQMGITTVMGGVHASVMTEEAVGHVDYVVKGEGEQALLDLVRGNVSERIISRPFIRNLDDVPRPAYELMDMNVYMRAKDRVPYYTVLFFVPPRARVAALLTSRGCPYSCIFCHNSWKGMPFREHSAGRVVDDMAYLIGTYRINALYFCDDNFFADKIRLRKICELVKERGIRTRWGCNARADSVDLETLKLARSAGCRQVAFGLESGSQKILDVLEKHATIEQSRRAIALCKESGVLCSATFMIGNPHETEEDVEATRRFILSSGLDCAGIGITVPFPGTGLWKWVVEKKFIPPGFGWDDFVTDKSSIRVSEYLTPQRVKQLRSNIYFQLALQPRQLLFLLKFLVWYPGMTFKKLISLVMSTVKKERA
jgi:anaerobic magnesium-protoporphyrin IX monomethyl ester cyclase